MAIRLLPPDLVKTKPPQYLLFLVDNLVGFFKYLEHQLFEAIRMLTERILKFMLNGETVWQICKRPMQFLSN
jgi:hypothetical protein